MISIDIDDIYRDQGRLSFSRRTLLKKIFRDDIVALHSSGIA